MNRIIPVVAISLLFGGAAFASDLYVDAQFDVTGKNLDKNFLTVKGPSASVEKDTVDVVTGASRHKGTDVWNEYRAGSDKKPALPLGLQSLVKYGVSPEKQFLTDNLNARKEADGRIVIQYSHRGTAYLMISDKNGVFTLPGADCKLRRIANLESDGSQTVSKDFSPTGKVGDINWTKVWDSSIRGGTLIVKGTTADGKVVEVKTSDIFNDVATSSASYVGTFKVTLNGNLMTVKGDLKTK
jgi:hypothetical protein